MFELKKDKGIFIVTNRHLIHQGNIYDVVEKCALRGADGIFLREKDLDYDSLKEMAEGIKNITDKYNIPLIINGNIQVAQDINAYGFHTGLENFKNICSKIKYINKIDTNEILDARTVNFNLQEGNSKKIVFGVSVHSVHEAIEAEKLGADYLIAGHVFETDCKLGLKGRGIEFIEKICENVSIPVIAIGGIGPDNLQLVLNTKVFGVAVMSYGMKI